VVSSAELWTPPQDTGPHDARLYRSLAFQEYLLAYLYSSYMIVGSDPLPSNQLETSCATLIVVLGTLIVGLLVGQFATY